MGHPSHAEIINAMLRAVRQVLASPFAPADDDDALYMYTDGSFAANGDHPGATWAFVVFAYGEPVVPD